MSKFLIWDTPPRHLNQLLETLDQLVASSDDDALALSTAGPGEAFRIGYGYERLLPSPLTSNRNFDVIEQRARTREWIGRARGLGLRGLLVADSIGYVVIDAGTEGAPYDMLVPNDMAEGVARLIPEAPEGTRARELGLLRRAEYQAAANVALDAERQARERGEPVHAIPLAVRALASAMLGDRQSALELRRRLSDLKELPEDERLRRGCAWWNASGLFVDSDRCIEMLLREIDDALAGRPAKWPH